MEDLVTLEPEPRPSAPPRPGSPMRVLVTGADGYIGSVLTPLLAERGYDVVGLDTGFYRSGWLYNDGKDRPPILTRDVRTLTVRDLEGYGAVVHLAELSNDPLCEHDPERTYEINHRGSAELARKSKAAGASRFIYSSSCSVYGAAADEIKTEESQPNPQTPYARCKMLVERDVRELADASFHPTFLRNATAFGASPRMRFDIVLNNLCGLAWTTRRILMTSDGTPWRPLVHVQDICEAVIAVLESPHEAVSGEIFNVGDDANNYRVREIAETISEVFPDCETRLGSNQGDNRSYRVSFAKIGKHLPNFRCRWGALEGAKQLRTLFGQVALSEHDFLAPPYTRVRQLKRLVDTGQLDPNFYWRADDLSRDDAFRCLSRPA